MHCLEPGDRTFEELLNFSGHLEVETWQFALQKICTTEETRNVQLNVKRFEFQATEQNNFL